MPYFKYSPEYFCSLCYQLSVLLQEVMRRSLAYFSLNHIKYDFIFSAKLHIDWHLHIKLIDKTLYHLFHGSIIGTKIILILFCLILNFKQF